MAPPRTKPRADLLTSWNLAAAEKALVEDALKVCNDIGQAAEKLGISRDAVKRRCAAHGIELPGKPQAAT